MMKKFLGFSVLFSKVFTLFCLSVSFFSISVVQAEVRIPCHEEVVEVQEKSHCETCIKSKNSWEIQGTVCDFSQEKIVKESSFVLPESFKEDSIVFSVSFFERAPPKIFVTAEYTVIKKIIVLRV